MVPSRTIATETDGAPVFTIHWRSVASAACSSTGDSTSARAVPDDTATAAIASKTTTLITGNPPSPQAQFRGYGETIGGASPRQGDVGKIPKESWPFVQICESEE